MSAFESFIARIASLWGLILAGGAIVPIMSIFSGFAPQGGLASNMGLATISGFLLLFVVLNVWVFASGLAQRTAKFVFAGFSVVALGILATYFVYSSQFQKDGFIAGCGWLPDTVAIARDDGHPTADQCPGEVQWMLEEAAEPNEIWRPASIRKNELTLYGLWAALTLAWAGMVAFFALTFLNGTPSNPPRPADADEIPSGDAEEPVS